MTELKPCPFCGCGTIEIDEYERFKCGACGVLLKFPDSPRQRDNAENGLIIDNYDLEWHMAAWNTRAERTCKNVTRHPGYGFKCSACRFWQYEPNDYGNHVTFSEWENCPKCGARVIEGDDE